MGIRMIDGVRKTDGVRKILLQVCAGFGVAVLGIVMSAAPAAASTSSALVASAAQQVQQKSATWGSLHVGDCQQDNGTMIVRSDGTGDWSATTLTYHTHSGDVWHSSFDFYTTAGYRLFHAGTFDSPRMNDGNPPPKYTWGAHFVFDPAAYPNVDIYKTIQHSSC